MTTSSRICGVVLIVCSLGLAAAPTAGADTYTVDDYAADAAGGVCSPPGGSCTLRSAVQAANAHANSLNPGGAPDRVELNAGTTSTLALPGANEGAAATGDLDVTEAVDVVGLGPLATRPTIDGGDVDRVFDVIGGGVALTLSNLVVTNGTATNDGGGGVRAQIGTALTLDRVLLSDHAATGALGRGGGISAVTATLRIVDSELSGNQANASGGGAFADGGSLTVERSLLTGNSTATEAGGGFRAVSADVDVSDTTFTGNSESNNGGAAAFVGCTGACMEPARFTGVTIAANNGNIDSGLRVIDDQEVVITGSILQANGSQVVCDDGGASPPSIQSGGGNVAASNATTTAECNLGSADKLATEAEVGLGMLADNGGATQTMALVDGSVATDWWSGCGSGRLDQRGLPRPAGGCDAGAFERQADPEILTAPVATGTTPPASTPPGGPGVMPPARPSISAFGMLRRTFHSTSALLFTLSQDAAITIVVQRVRPGRRVGRRCAAPNRANRRRKRCSRFTQVRTVRRAARQGRNRVAFNRRAGRQRLPRGRYRATIRARNANGTSAVRRVFFRIV